LVRYGRTSHRAAAAGEVSGATRRRYAYAATDATLAAYAVAPPPRMTTSVHAS